MFSRIYSLALIFSLAACGGPGGADSLEEAEAQAAASGAEDGRIACALAGSDSFSETCSIEQSQGSEGTILTIRHPDGGFRRLEIATDGRGVIAADGAETAVVSTLAEGLIEVRLGDARYRLPATVKASK
jgi:hypothetical protein